MVKRIKTDLTEVSKQKVGGAKIPSNPDAPKNMGANKSQHE